MKFYLDEDADPRIAAAARVLGVDIVSAHEIGMRGVDDHTQLACAAADGRCIVTFNKVDFIAATRQAYEKTLPHHGVLLLQPHLRYTRHGLIAKTLAAYAARIAQDSLPAYTIDFLPPSGE